MARARQISDLDCDAPFAEAAARVIRARADELFEHSRGVLDTGDIERVHDMRVATRRLRAAMEIFEACFPPKRWRKALIVTASPPPSTASARSSARQTRAWRRRSTRSG